MWDTATDTTSAGAVLLSHDLPCFSCGHAGHSFLACSEDCACTSVLMPGAA